MAQPIDSMDEGAAPRLERCRASLAENLCRRVPENLEPLGMGEQHSLVAGNASFWRCWEFASETDLSVFQDFLVKFTSAGNTQASAYVTDPQVQGETIRGKFRGVAVRRLKKEGKLLIAQGLRRVYAPATVTALAALAYRKTRANEWLQPLGLGPGEQDDVAWIFPDMDPANESVLLALADADLVTALPGAGWTYVSRKLEHGEDNGAELAVIFRKVVWSAFAYTAPDLAWYDNEGREDNDRTEEWIGINVADALAGLYTSDTTKYNVARVKITERGDGAKNVQRVLVHEIYGSAEAGTVNAASQETLNVHGLVAGTLDKILVINENLKLKASAYTALPSGYTLAQMREEKNSYGLWNIYYLYSKATWGNSTPTWTQSGRSNVSGHEAGIEKIANGVPIADAATKLAAVTADANYVIRSAGFAEGLPGEAKLQLGQMRTFEYGTTGVDAPVLTRKAFASSKQDAAVEFWWPRVSVARVGAVETAAESLASYNSWFADAYPAASGWKVKQVDLLRHGDGAVTIVGTLYVPSVTGDTDEVWGGAAIGPWWTFQYVRDSDGVIIRTIKYGNKMRQYFTQANAEGWLEDISDGTISSYNLLKEGSGVDRIGPSRYLAVALWKEAEYDGEAYA